MAKFLKRIVQLILAVVIIFIIAIIGIINFVNPNQFKGTIEQEVLAKTGLVLTVQGPIQWRWFPMLSLEFNNIAIQNPPPFPGQLLSAKSVQAECELLPAFLGKIALSVNIKNLDLALFKNAKGQTNWENLNQLAKNTETERNAKGGPTVQQDKNATQPSRFSIALNSLKIQEGKINFNDLSKNTHYLVQHFNLSADNLSKSLAGVTAPLSLDFELASLQEKLAHIVFNTEWALKQDQEQLNLKKIALKIKLPDGSTNVISGNTEIQGFSKAPAIKGNLMGNNLQFGKIKIDTLKTAIAAENGIINFAPIDIHIAKNQQKATLKCDVRGNIPKMYFTQEIQDCEINNLLALLDKKDKLSGKMRLTMNLSAMGTDLSALQNSLSGTAKLEIDHGKLYGVDVTGLVKKTQSTIHALSEGITQNLKLDSLTAINTQLENWKIDSKSSSFTPFNSLKATATITNGVIHNPDLVITHPDYTVNGGGVINLSANTIQYKTALALKNNLFPANDKIGNFLFQTPVIVQIEGNLNDPKIRPDLKSYANQAFAFTQTLLLEKVINKSVDKAIDKVTGNEAVHDTVHKALGKILGPKK